MSYMSGSGWIQLVVFCVGLILITKPMGLYLPAVLDPEVEGGLGIMEKILGPVERLIYKIGGIDPKKQQNWKQYLFALLGLGLVTILLSYALFRIQDKITFGPMAANMKSLAQSRPTTPIRSLAAARCPGSSPSFRPPALSPIRTGRATSRSRCSRTSRKRSQRRLHFFFSSAVGIAGGACGRARSVARKRRGTSAIFGSILPARRFICFCRSAWSSPL